MKLCITVTARPRPGTWAHVVVLVIVLIAVMTAWRAGYDLPDIITLVFGTGIIGTATARSLLVSPARGEDSWL